MYRDSVLYYNSGEDSSFADQFQESLESGMVVVCFLALWNVPCTAKVSLDVHEGLVRTGGEICLFEEEPRSIIEEAMNSVEKNLRNFSARHPHSSFSLTYVQDFNTHLEEIEEEAL
mgnify:FL=1